MSTVQKQTSTRTVTQQSTETSGVTQTSTTTSRQTNRVQITQRGLFFDDACFEDTRNDFRNAISDVVSRFGDKSSNIDELTQYRSLRSREIRDENQAITSSQDDSKYKIVVDVQDFVSGGEINVKVVEEREVVVEGRVQKVEGNRTSSKSFQRSFFLPEDVDVDTLASVMSADGVLTITAIRRTVTQQLTQVPVSIQKVENRQVTTTTSTTGVQEIPVPVQPVQDSNQTVSVQKVTKITQQTTSTDSSTPQSPEKPLPIAKKGDFFNDSFFEDTRQHFQTAVHDVLQKMNIQTSTTDELSTYRNLRQRELREETQAATVNEDQTTHKVVVDVQDFINGGEVNVKVVNEREIIIEGHVEKKEGNTTSTKRFRKRYVLPEDIEVEKVTSVMSSDGVLTITTPKKPSALPLSEVPVNIQKIENKKVTTTTTTTGVQETPVPVQPAQPAQPVQDTDQTVSVQKVTKITQQTTSTDSSTPQSPEKPLPIAKKGDFFNDSFFEDTRQHFQTAVHDVLQKMNIQTSTTDELSTYRNLRQRELREETQAATVNEDQTTHKVVVDVQDFINGGEVNVKVVNEREIIIEGHVEKKEGNTTTKRFRKRYVLPEDIEVEKVTSVMSSDGVLTITTPKKPSPQQLSEVPVSIQKIENKKVTTTTTTTGVQETPVPVQPAQPAQPVQDTDQTVSVQKVTKITQQTTSTDSSTPQSPEKPLPIAKKGDFFNDSFFEDTRQHFQTAVHDVLQKMNIQTSTTDELSTYRNLRQRELREETQAATVNEDQTTHKVVVDVQDFINGGEVNVKVVNEREIIIEGHVEKKEGNTTSTKRFRKRYVLPEDIEVEKVTSVMSSDGVLTITTPKKPSSQPLPEVPVSIQKIENKKVTTTTTTTGVQETPVPVQPAQPAQPVQDTDQTVSVQKVTKITQQTTSTDSSTPQSPEKPLPIAKKGDFFNDSFFEDTRQHFQTAVHEVLQKMNIQTSTTDELSTYRNLRQRELREETQAATVNEDQTTHKIVVDVQDFVNGGEVTVKIVNEREVIIEGHVEKMEGNKTSIKRFRKRYVLPENIEVEKVTSVMSSDGVLTIKTPKKPSSQPLTQVTPVSIQKIENKKQETITQETKTTTDKSVTDVPSRILTIIKKGNFFSDTFFEDCRQNFQTAVIQILKKLNIETSTVDIMTTYRTIRQRELREETQAITEKESEQIRKFVVDAQDFVNGGEVTVKVVQEREVVVEGRVDRLEGGVTSTKRFKKTFILSENIQVNSVTAVMSADGILTITAPKKVTQQQQVAIEKATDKKEAVVQKPGEDRVLPVNKKGSFLSDPYFQDSRQDFQSSVTEVVMKSSEKDSKEDHMTIYRRLRQKTIKLENQAVSVKEDAQFQKIVLDVLDFMNGELKVMITSENILVVEGRGTRQEGVKTSSHSFLRRFIVPDNVIPESIEATLSSDGILTIFSKKQQ
ncbi:uncharacterized protein LOC134786751 [Penaeus indicus]|uniref:uncharacterized protein LOC134786751 n=1 Tax=Penaeus indicus TaxID=29960 RepID=UPI00300C6620